VTDGARPAPFGATIRIFLERIAMTLTRSTPQMRVSPVGLSLCFNHEEFCDELYVHRETCAFAVFPVSGGLFEGGVALGPPRTAPFGPPGRSSARFRWFRWRPKLRQNRQNPTVDPQRRQPTGGVAPLPRQPTVGHARACQPKLRVSGEHQPRPAVGLLGMAHPRGGPSHTLLEEAKRVLQVEAPRVGPP